MDEQQKRSIRLAEGEWAVVEAAHRQQNRVWLACMDEPLRNSDRLALIWSAHQAYLAIKRAMRGH